MAQDDRPRPGARPDEPPAPEGYSRACDLVLLTVLVVVVGLLLATGVVPLPGG